MAADEATHSIDACLEGFLKFCLNGREAMVNGAAKCLYYLFRSAEELQLVISCVMPQLLSKDDMYGGVETGIEGFADLL